MLGGLEIQRQVGLGKIVIEDFDPQRLNPNSYNLRLGKKLKVYNIWNGHHAKLWPEATTPPVRVLDMKADNPTLDVEIPDDGLILVPGLLYLGTTMEYTETHGFVPTIEGRSSIGRLGIKTHITAGFGDVGFTGRWTLEIEVTHPIRVYAGVEFCQIAYDTVEGDYIPYKSKKYQGQDGAVSSRLWMEFSKSDGRHATDCTATETAQSP